MPAPFSSTTIPCDSTPTSNYFTRYENLHMERTPSGVLTLRFHTNGGPTTFTGTAHRDLPKALADIGDDRANKVLDRARYFALMQQQLTALEAERLGLANEVVAKNAVYPRALELAEQLAARPQLFLRYTTIALRQRLLARLNTGIALGMALEGLTAADLAYQV